MLSKDSSRKLVLLPRYGNVVFVLRQYCLSATATLFLCYENINQCNT